MRSADSPGRKPYHHGALHKALVEASIALAREGGPDRVILREAARAAGVSHSAAYRHFADREALLAEVSRYARGQLAAEMRRKVKRSKDPRQRLHAVGTPSRLVRLAGVPQTRRPCNVAMRPGFRCRSAVRVRGGLAHVFARI